MTGMRLFPLIVPFVALLVAPLRAQQPDTIRLALRGR
jgi:hypothetical protein